MEIADIETRIKQIISDNTRLKPEQIGPGVNFWTELGIDSLSVLEVVLSIDREFRTNFTEAQLREMVSVSQAVQMVAAFLQKRG